MVGAEFAGQVFEDQFLIADVKMTAAFPTERWFWFDPPFHAGRSALLHKQPDDIWRIDLQLNPDADPAVEKRPENVRPRIARMLGHDKFDFEWISLYKFQCRRMDKFIHGRVMFAGDAAHQVSPFGARGANSGLEDAENLAWKLDRVLRGISPEALLESYHTERSAAADENIRESTRSTDFMAPSSHQEARLAQGGAVARQGNRIRQAHGQWRAALGAVDLRFRRCRPPIATPGAAARGPARRCRMRRSRSAPAVQAFLTEAFIKAGTRFTLLEFSNGAAVEVPDGVGVIRIGGDDGLVDAEGLAGARYDAEPGTAYLLRPDGYVAARFRHPTRAALDAALGARRRHELRFSSWRCPPVRISPSRMTPFAPSSRRIAD